MLQFRNAGMKDAEAIAHLHAASWRENFRGTYADEYLDGAVVEDRRRVWQERLTAPASNQSVILAMNGADLAGFVCAYGAHNTQLGSFIDNLHVSGRHQRSGIGRQLMRRIAEDLCAEYGEIGVYLWVLENNSNARQFYEVLGASNSQVREESTPDGGTAPTCIYVWPSPAHIVART